MKIYDIIQPKASDVPIIEVLPGTVVQSFSGELFIRCADEGSEIQSCKLVSVESGLIRQWLANENSFTIRTDIVLTTDCNLRNRPE